MNYYLGSLAFASSGISKFVGSPVSLTSRTLINIYPVKVHFQNRNSCVPRIYISAIIIIN